MPRKKTIWKPDFYPKICPKCGKKSIVSHFNNGTELYCSDYENCDWETGIQNPNHPTIGPGMRELSMTLGRKKLISLGRN